MDLTYFGTPRAAATSSLSRAKLDTSAAWAELSSRYSSISHVQGTCPQARFSHLTIYGASYYSYLYARGLAEAVWQRHLAADPLDREAGGWQWMGDRQRSGIRS